MGLDPERVKDVFLTALEKRAPQERADFVTTACMGNAEMQRRVEALLAAHQSSGGWSGTDAGFGSRGSGSGFDSATDPPPLEVEFLDGTVIAGRYRLLNRLGEGGMGTVYAAEQSEPVRRKVAVKLIKAGMDSLAVLARFEQERQALAVMDHPNIAKVYDAGTVGGEARGLTSLSLGCPYFVMELIDGVPLTKFCDDAQLSIRDRLELFIPICQAVQHAHQKGIIHRDLKPSNILVSLHDGKPVPKIIDFGLAKATREPLTERTLQTAADVVLGTPLYMSPEQADLNNADVDTRSDIYTLGVILYELLTGVTPLERGRFKVAAWDEMLRVIREEDPPKPSSKLSTNANLPSVAALRRTEPLKLTRFLRGDLDWIAMKALEKDRNRRYETANGFALDIQRYLDNEPVSACPPSAGYRARKFIRRNRGQVAAASLVLLALIAGFIGTSLGLLEANRQRDAATSARIEESKQRQTAMEQRAAAVAERDAKEKARAAEAEQRAQAEAARRRADEEADIATTVNDFLQNDLLSQADIANQAAGAERNPNITVRELLDRAAKNIETKFKGREVTEAAIRHTLDRAYAGLGDSAEARKHHERSLKLRKDKLGADHPKTMECINNLATLDLMGGQFEQAEARLKPVVAAGAGKDGRGQHELLEAMNLLAIAYQNRARIAEAEPLLKQVMDYRVKHYGPEHPDTLGSMHNLAMIYLDRGRPAEAEPLFRRVYELGRAHRGIDHPDTLTALNNLARSYFARNRIAEAAPLFKEAYEVSRAKLGPEHASTLRNANNLAAAYRMLNRFDEAESLYKSTLESRRKKLGADHPETLTVMNNLGDLYKQVGRFAESESLYNDCLEKSRAKRGADHPETLTVMSNLMTLYAATGRYQEAVATAKKVLDGRRAKLGADHPQTIVSLYNTARLQQVLGNCDAAEPLYRESLALMNAKFGAAHPQTQSANQNYCELLEACAKPDRAEPIRSALIGFARKQAGSAPAALAAQLAALALNQLSQKKFAEAEAAALECLALREKTEPNAWTTDSAKSLLGAALAGQKKYVEAEPLLRQGYEGMKRHAGKTPGTDAAGLALRLRMTEALARVIEIYEVMGRPAEAAKFRAEQAALKTSAKPAPGPATKSAPKP